MAERSVVVKLRAEISGLKSELKQASSLVEGVGTSAQKGAGKSKVALADLQKSLRDNEQSVRTLSSAALGIGAGLGIGVGAVVKTFADFDKQMSSVASTGADAKANIDGLRDSAIKLGAATAFSATEAAEGVENLLKAGVSAADVMGGGLKGSLDLAAAGELGVADASEIAATALTQFKLQGKDVPHIADLLAAGAGKAQGEVGDLAAALNQSGLVASQFGLSIEDTTGTLAAFASAGLLGSDAGTSFKTMLLSLASPSAKSTEKMAELGIAAYDAQGNFIGLEGLAEQLQTRLGGLTDQQRQSALATIFGTDAIRAASELYNQGGEGIRDWTEKVNDAGYASETAATKLDNLSGDVEAFRGSLESSFIQAGSGGNDFLRGAVRSATDLVNVVGELPAPLLQTGVGVAAVGSASLLAVGGIGKLALGVNETHEALTRLAPAGSRARGVVAGLGKAVGIAAGAMVGLQIAGAVIRQLDDEFVPSVDDATGALLRLSEAGNVAQLDDMFSIETSTTGIDSVSEALTRLGENRALDAVGAQVESFMGTNASVTQQIAAQFTTLDDAISGLDANEAADAFANIAQQAESAGFPIERLVELFPAYAASVRTAADAQGITITSTAQLADLMRNGLPAGLDSTTAAAGTSAAALGNMGASSEAASKKLDDLVDSLFAAADAAIGLSDAEIGYEAAVDAASEAVKKNKRNLDLNTEAGRGNREALNRLASQSHSYIEELVAQGASTGKVTEKTRDARKEFIEVAKKMGLSSSEAKKLADKYGLIPKDVKTRVRSEGGPKTRTEIQKIQDRLEALKDQGVNIDFKTNAAEIARAYNIRISNRGTTGAQGGNPVLRADGGPLNGPGTATSDSILLLDRHTGSATAWGSDGEYVTNAAQYAKNKDQVETINSGGKWDLIPRRAGGGPVTPDISISAGSLQGGYPRFDDLANRLAQQLGDRIGDSLGKRLDGLLSSGAGPTDVNNPRGLTTFNGGTFTNLAAANLRAAERIAGTVISVMQGGHRPETSYSGTSHAGDAVDTPNDPKVGRAIRQVGWAWGDRARLGNWNDHGHGVPGPGHGFAGGSAVWQYQDYLRRGGPAQSLGSPWGLANGAVIRGDHGGVLARVGEGRHDELVTPLPQGWDLAQQSRQTQMQAQPAQIDTDAMRTAVRDGAREGIERHLRTLNPRETYALVRSAGEFGRARGGDR